MSETDVKTETEQPKIVNRTMPEWTDFVMGHFIESELEKGNPKVGGLRRVSELLIGNIVGLYSDVVAGPNRENDHRAVVTVRVIYALKDPNNNLEEKHVTFSGSADASYRNISPDFAAYPVAMAETRAKARAYRNALGLDVVCAEELAESAIPDDFSDELINDNQIKVIEALCKRLNINVKKFANMGKTEYNSIRKVPYDVAIKMSQQLSKYQQDMDSIPETIKLFDAKWRKEFDEGSV